MFLSRLFKRRSTKLLTLFGALTMALGVGAAMSQTVAQEQNEVVETKAANFSTTPNYFWWSSSGIDEGNNQYIRYWLYFWRSSDGKYKSVIPMTAVSKDPQTGDPWTISKNSWDISTSNATTWNGGNGIYCAYIGSDSNRSYWDRCIVIRSKYEIGITTSNLWDNAADKVVNQSEDINITGITSNNAVYFTGWQNGKMTASLGQVSFAKKMTGSTTLGYVAKAGQMTTTLLGSATPTVYGKTFSNWCTNSTLTTSFTNNSFFDGTVYAKFSDTTTSTGYFSLTFFMNEMWPVEANLPTVYIEDKNGNANADWPGSTATKVNYEYGIISFAVPNEASKITIAVNGWSSGGAQTIDITNWSSKASNLYVLTGITNGKYSGSWHYTDYAAPTTSSSILPGYYFEGGASDGDWKPTSFNHMGPNTANMADKGHIDDFTVASGNYFKVVRIRTTASADEYIGYDSLDTASKALKNTSGGTLITDGYDHNLVFTASETICVYLTSSNEISITTNSAKAAAGYLYVTGTLSSITFYAYSNTAGTDQIHTGTLNSITGVTTLDTAYMNDVLTLHRIPIFNLRGPSASDVVSFKLGSSGVIIAPSVSSSNSPAVYYAGSGSTVYNNDATGKLAKATYNIALAIGNAEDHSVCNLGSGTKTALLADAAIWKGSTLYSKAAVKTYAPDGNKEDMISAGTTGKVSLAKIVAQLDGTASASSAWFVGSRGTESSPLTTTLWIVLGAGMAGLTAIGAAYFISKKRKRA